MRKWFLFAGLSAIVAAGFALGAASVAKTAQDDVAARMKAARPVVKEFGKSLKGKLISAMKSGGPMRAISVCTVAAPEITERLSEAKGWRVARTALKVRNPGNAPDAWERKVLEMFVAKAKGGADPKTLEHGEFAVVDGEKVFRYMKAIPTAKPCLTCHGTNIDAKVSAAIKDAYPEDKATGFKLGDIRGAFTITQPMGK